MPSRYYDVVVLGRSLGALTAAVLLSRRDFRVLLVGQGQRPQTYRYEGRLLARRTFALLAGSSPAFRRMLEELAQIPQFRRRTQHLDPMYTLLCDGRRIEVPPDIDLFAREVDREFAEVRQLVDELYTTVAHVNAGADTGVRARRCVAPGRRSGSDSRPAASRMRCPSPAATRATTCSASSHAAMRSASS